MYHLRTEELLEVAIDRVSGPCHFFESFFVRCRGAVGLSCLVCDCRFCYSKKRVDPILQAFIKPSAIYSLPPYKKKGTEGVVLFSRLFRCTESSKAFAKLSLRMTIGSLLLWQHCTNSIAYKKGSEMFLSYESCLVTLDDFAISGCSLLVRVLERIL